jgi:hypothetical protein
VKYQHQLRARKKNEESFKRTNRASFVDRSCPAVNFDMVLATRSGAHASIQTCCHLDVYDLKMKCFTWKRKKQRWKGPGTQASVWRPVVPYGVNICRTSQSRVRRAADVNAETRKGKVGKCEHATGTRRECGSCVNTCEKTRKSKCR